MLGGEAPASLEPLWRTLMINQFHDILPGSSIPEVYARTEPELAGVVAQAEEVAGAAMTALAARLGGEGEDALLIVNPDAGRRPVRLVSRPADPGRAGGRGRLRAGEPRERRRRSPPRSRGRRRWAASA